MQLVMTEYKHFKGRNTAENIRLEYDATVSAYEISGKIITIAKYNNINIVKAFDFQL